MEFLQVLDLADDFFLKRGAVYEAVGRLARRMADEDLPYAVVGGMAMAAHGYMMYTGEIIDVVTTAEGAAAFASFCEAETQVKINVKYATECPESVEIDGYRVITLPKLIEMKLMSGLSSPLRLRDLGDVQCLIIELKLPLSIADSLDPSVRDEYLRMWDAAQTPDALKE